MDDTKLQEGPLCPLSRAEIRLVLSVAHVTRYRRGATSLARALSIRDSTPASATSCEL